MFMFIFIDHASGIEFTNDCKLAINWNKDNLSV